MQNSFRVLEPEKQQQVCLREASPKSSVHSGATDRSTGTRTIKKWYRDTWTKEPAALPLNIKLKAHL